MGGVDSVEALLVEAFDLCAEAIGSRLQPSNCKVRYTNAAGAAKGVMWDEVQW